MPSRPARSAQSRRRRTSLRRGSAVALSATSIALLAAMPTASALASSGASGGSDPSHTVPGGAPRPQTAPGELLSPGQLQTLLATLPLSDLSTTQLAHYLAGLEDISVLASLQVGLPETEELGLAGLEEGLSHGIEQLGPGATIGELANTAVLLPDIEAKLDDLLTSLLGSALGSSQQQDLSEALATLNLDQLVGALLASTKEPAQLSGLADLTGKLFEELGPGGLEGILGSSPLAGGFAPTTVENVAHELGTTPEALSGELGQNASQLPAATTMLTAPVTDGKLLAVAPAVKGLALGLLGAGEEAAGAGSGAGGGTSEGGGSGGSGKGASGAPGTSGSGGNAGNLTVVVNMPSAQAAVSTPASAAKSAKPSKVKVLSWRTEGTRATITLLTPAAGRLTLGGHGVTSTTRTVAHATRVSLKVRLSKAGIASLHRRRGRLKIKLDAAFKTTAGARSAATATLSFR
jgi:hypothetical protein